MPADSSSKPWSGKGTQTDFGVSTGHLLENVRKQCREWPAGKTEIKLLIQENSKPHDLIVYTDGSVTKDQSRWGFTVKEGVTTMHESESESEY